MSLTPKTDAACFDLIWRNGAYYVSKPDIKSASVVPVNVAVNLEIALGEALARIDELQAEIGRLTSEGTGIDGIGTDN